MSSNFQRIRPDQPILFVLKRLIVAFLFDIINVCSNLRLTTAILKAEFFIVVISQPGLSFSSFLLKVMKLAANRCKDEQLNSNKSSLTTGPRTTRPISFIDTVKWETPPSGLHTGKMDVDINFSSYKAC